MGAPLALNEFRLKIQKSAALTNSFFFLFYLAGKKKAKNKVSCRLFKNTTWFLFKKSRIFKLRTGLNSLRFKTTDTHRISLYKKTRSSSLGAQNSRCRLSSASPAIEQRARAFLTDLEGVNSVWPDVAIIRNYILLGNILKKLHEK